MGYQIITKMVYNARTHQIETWRHSNNVWPRIDHFRALDVRTDEQLFREYPELRMDSSGMNSMANPGRSIVQSAASMRNWPGAKAPTNRSPQGLILCHI